MSDYKKAGIWKKTISGRVVYDRPKHFFSPKGIHRILVSFNNQTKGSELRKGENAGYVRAIKRVADNLYGSVRDLFEPGIPDEDLNKIKAAFKKFNQAAIDKIADTAAVVITGVAGPEAGIPSRTLIRWIGYRLDDWLELLITGSNVYASEKDRLSIEEVDQG